MKDGEDVVRRADPGDPGGPLLDAGERAVLRRPLERVLADPFPLHGTTPREPRLRGVFSFKIDTFIFLN